MPAIYRYQHTVATEEIDGQGHVGNLEYLKWMLAAAVEHSAARGWPAERYRQAQVGWVVRTHQIEYLRPAFAGQQIDVVTWLSELKKLRCLRKYKIVRPDDDAVLVVAQTEWVMIDTQRHSPRRVPAELTQAFQLVAAEDEP